ncbi:uncharacterized protein LOC123316079 [Coccinella septempunctata]|uniref:uncharacterized protein LOC123316079 n=1 Tax=Coccinella septempunctata TaxID=41139 RepID=UPI001D073442|nr:uncharacterized protein LOC123316079 [Coccinella septempunctata]
MNSDKPPAYSDNMGFSGPPYQQLMNEPVVPQNSQMQNFNPYGNMPQMPSPIIITPMQPPVMQPGTTVNVNTGPVEKRYCCSCCCTCFWIIVVILLLAGLSRTIQ